MASSSPQNSACSKEPADNAKALGANLEKGLSTQEAAARVAKNGPNEFQSAPPTPGWRRVLAQFQDPLIYLLLAFSGCTIRPRARAPASHSNSGPAVQIPGSNCVYEQTKLAT